MDFAYLAGIVAFFVLVAALAAGCDRLQKRPH